MEFTSPAPWAVVSGQFGWFLLGVVAPTVVCIWLASLAGEPKLLALLALLPGAGVLIFAVVVIMRRNRKLRAIRWADEETE